jgi:phosphoenolpyruvate-protein kinase (PTS system EI component)
VSTEAEVAALRAATREAHEAIKDLRAVIREAKEVKEKLGVEMTDVWDNGMREVVSTGLAEYNTTIKRAIDEATQAVFDRFNVLADRLLGVDKGTRRRGEFSIEELVRRVGR